MRMAEMTLEMKMAEKVEDVARGVQATTAGHMTTADTKETNEKINPMDTRTVQFSRPSKEEDVNGETLPPDRMGT